MNKPVKILAVTDDIRAKTGVGIQANKFLTHLAKTYKVFQLGASINATNNGAVEYEGVTIIPVDHFGTKLDFQRALIDINPEIVLLFSDPRFFEHILNIDNEIRPESKIILYHLWDNEPYPDFNEAWYGACDDLVMISKFSYDLLKPYQDVSWIPHGFDENEFYPLEEKQISDGRKLVLDVAGYEDSGQFIVFWNNNNISRKRPADVILAFKSFHSKYPNSLLLINSSVINIDGTDLKKVIQKFCNNVPIIMNIDILDTDKLNLMYNISDVSLNISYNEGFGLSVGESLMAGVPVICTKTGGMPEQQPKIAFDLGLVIEPKVKELYGLVTAPYLFRDYVAIEDVKDSLEIVYKLRNEDPEKWLALKTAGREHIKKNYNIKTTLSLWDEHIEKVLTMPSKFKEYEIITI